MNNKWLQWAKQLQSISQSGIEYSKDKYDIERFKEIRELSVEILNEYTDIDHKKIRNLFANEKGYQTPKVDVRAAIFLDNKILLVKEQLDNKWSLPGGWADIDISVYDNVIKESLEEAGAVVLPKRVIAILDRNKHVKDNNPYSIYKIFVECNYISESFMSNIETEESGFFSIDNLPELTIGRNTFEQIEMCFRAKDIELFEVICD